VDVILMRGLPVQKPDSLLVLNRHSKSHPKVAQRMNGASFQDPKTGYTSGNFPYPVFELFRDKNTVFSSVFAFKTAGRLNIKIQRQADLAAAQYVSDAFFSSLGVPPAAGRLIGPDDDRAGAAPVAVISFGYAQRRFGEIA